MASPRLSIRLTEQLQKDLLELAKAQGKSESEVARDALEEYCKKHLEGPSCYDLAKAIGLLGCAKNLPPDLTDLSTNERHMEGFGRD